MERPFVAKPRATKSKRKKPASEPLVEATPAPKSVPPKANSAPPRAASVRPPPPSEVEQVPEPTPSVARWEERGDKDAYALDLLERLVRYYGGRASATSSDAMRSAAVVLSTLSLCLTSSDDEQLTALARAAREIRKGST
jgi:hypothetical protein